MEFVEPIKSAKKIAQIKNTLKGQERYRDLLLFTIGINSALRISDLLNLRIGDLLDNGDSFTIREGKTNKRKRVTINQNMRETIELYLVAYPDVERDSENFVFFNERTHNYDKPITRQMAWKIVSDICADVGLTGNYGTHTLRKTWGYFARQNGVDMGNIMFMLNHSNIAETKRYLGLSDEELSEVVMRLNL